MLMFYYMLFGLNDFFLKNLIGIGKLKSEITMFNKM
jgi:hypothetical protein